VSYIAGTGRPLAFVKKVKRIHTGQYSSAEMPSSSDFPRRKRVKAAYDNYAEDNGRASFFEGTMQMLSDLGGWIFAVNGSRMYVPSPA
jgi:hypothetical protein